MHLVVWFVAALSIGQKCCQATPQPMMERGNASRNATVTQVTLTTTTSGNCSGKLKCDPPPSLGKLFKNIKIHTYKLKLFTADSGIAYVLPSPAPTSVVPRNRSNLTENLTEKKMTKTTGLNAETITTMVGCSTSIVALLVLIVVYALFKELRNLPGKVLMNLACSIICFQAVFLSSGETEIRAVCVAIAVMLHYFSLVSFMWMAVMGYDLAKTFTSKGRVDTGGNNLKTLVIYCCLAWGGPLVLVTVCFTFDVTEAAYFGYGKGEFCWIQNGLALTFSFRIPVALALLFNIVALARTLIAIHQAKKATRRVATQRPQPSLAFLYVKLTMVLGVPWVLGYVANYSPVLQYTCTVFNAFQGLFISLVFLTNGRVSNLMRSKICARKRNGACGHKDKRGSREKDKSRKYEAINKKAAMQDETVPRVARKQSERKNILISTV